MQQGKGSRGAGSRTQAGSRQQAAGSRQKAEGRRQKVKVELESKMQQEKGSG